MIHIYLYDLIGPIHVRCALSTKCINTDVMLHNLYNDSCLLFDNVTLTRDCILHVPLPEDVILNHTYAVPVHHMNCRNSNAVLCDESG